MKDNEKTKEQLVKELTELRSQNAALEKTRKELAVIKIAADEVSVFAENIIDTVREPLIALDQDLRVVKVSRSFYEFFKVAPEETMGQLIYDLGNKQWDIPKLRELLEAILPQKSPFNDYEVEHDFAGIGRRTMFLNARQIQQASGKERIILLAIEDITERKLAEEKLRIAALVESSKDAIIGKSLDGIITAWNKGAEAIYGYTKSEIIGKSISVLTPPELPDEMTEMLKKIKLGEGILGYETVRQRKDGQYIYISLTVSAIQDAEGRIVGASAIARDITERKRLENLLKESETQYRLLFENANDGIVLLEKSEGKIANVNPSIERMLGYSAKEVIGNKLRDVGLIIDNGDFQITMKNLNERGILRYNDVPVKTKSGQEIYTDTYLVDKAKFAQCNIRDITERRKAEVELKESKALIEAVVENVPLMIFLKESKDLRFVIFNRAGEELLGYDRRDLMGKNNLDLFPPEQAAQFMAKDREVLDGELGFLDIPEEPIMTAKKGERLLHTRKVCIRGSDGTTKYLLGISEDITERKQAEEKLQDTLESLRKSFAATIQVMVSAVESRDPYTAGHQIRSADLSRAIATEMELPQDTIEGLRMAGSIHDIGKLSIPAEILAKPTKLSDIELALIKEHSRKGYEMLKDVESPWPLAQIVYQHHERIDGSGYPRNLKGEEICIEARILSVADVVEAMASHRPYRPGLGIDTALTEIEKNRGIFYDAAVADACLRLFREKGFKLERT